MQHAHHRFKTNGAIFNEQRQRRFARSESQQTLQYEEGGWLPQKAFYFNLLQNWTYLCSTDILRKE